jgi:hypothetical protein
MDIWLARSRGRSRGGRAVRRVEYARQRHYFLREDLGQLLKTPAKPAFFSGFGTNYRPHGN